MADPLIMPTQTLDKRREAERRKYLKLATNSGGGGGYGSTNHGRHAYATVISWQPRFVVDFGCGCNDFIRELRRRGIDGLGVDFVNARADIVAAMHCVPLAGGIADAVTSFDALEHLLPEDVDPVLAEMRRVATSGGGPGGRFIFSICTRPSRITVDGQNLHPTVRPIEWWLERIARVALITDVTRYVTGVFHA
jgi:SAM-dependent methyltransferase